jgi:hypothetical protein
MCHTTKAAYLHAIPEKKETMHFCVVRQRTGLCTVYPLTGFNKTIKPILKNRTGFT